MEDKIDVFKEQRWTLADFATPGIDVLGLRSSA
jgi:hypothetical protein